MAIESIVGAGFALPPVTGPTAAAQAPAAGFESGALQGATDALASVEATHRDADEALRLLATGESVDLHGTMIALEKADIALRTMVTVRDKMVGAYERVMNMAI